MQMLHLFQTGFLVSCSGENLGLSLSIPLSASVDAAQSSDVGSPLVGDCAAQVSNIHADSR